ncbi:MAG: M1 family aminopeptidase, partial [Planctomycetota bacterium]
RLEYDWMPRGGLAEARDGRIQTHMSSFWIPSMANERFDAEVEIVTDLPAITSGTREKTADGWRFRTGVSAQIVPLVVGPFSTHRRGDIELFLPPGIECEPEEVLEDAERVLALLEEWFGPRPEKEFRIAFAHNPRPMPSYCGGNFILLSRPSTPSLLGRARWISLFAHECAHMWWGHHVGMPVIGQGGNWLREGIPQWVGITAVEKLVGNDEARRRWRVHVAAYLATADLRRDDRGIFANEATLLDSTYLDPPRVAYWRGALVLRRLAYRLGREEFLRRLGVIQKERTQSTIEIEEFTRRMDAEADVAYYARRTRLPDFALDGRVIRCLDPAWPDGKVPVRVTTAGGVEVLDVDVKDGKGTLPARTGVESIEIDPERILLDPVLSNNRG